jgi:hypothetical protein
MRWRRTTQPFVSYRPKEDSTANTIKNLEDRLNLIQTVSLAGSEWNVTVEQELQLESDAESNNFPIGDSDDELELEDEVEVTVIRYAHITQNLSLVQSSTISGGRVPGGGGGSDPTVTAIFDSNALIGFAVYVSSNGHVDNAQADSQSTTGVAGFSNVDVTAGNTGTYLTEGPITRDDWTPVAGTEFLVPGDVYYLSATNAGQITNVAPTADTEFVVVLGRAATTTQLDIELAPPVLL